MTKMREILNRSKIASFETECPSPDSSGILFLAPFARKRYSG